MVIVIYVSPYTYFSVIIFFLYWMFLHYIELHKIEVLSLLNILNSTKT